MIILFIVDNNHHILYHDYIIHCGQNKKVAANYSARLWHSQTVGKVGIGMPLGGIRFNILIEKSEGGKETL